MVSVNTFIQDGNTTLHIAALRGNLEIVTKLLDCGAEVDMKNNVRRSFVME